MKKIFFIPGIVSKVIGGTEMQMQLLAEALKRQNYDIHGVLLHDLRAFSMYKNDFYRNRLYTYCGMNSIFIKTILDRLHKVKPDIVYQRGGLPFLFSVSRYSRESKCKSIWHIASITDVVPFRFKWERTALFNYVDKKFLEHGIKNVDCIIGQAGYQSELLKKHYGRECDLIVPNFHPEPQCKIRKERVIKIVWVANLKKGKQPEYFLKLAEHLRHRPGLKLVMIGRRAHERYQKKLDDFMKKLNNFEYMGELPIDEVNKILCTAHIFVNTSKDEGFPNTFIQAWMRKVPVVTLEVDPDDVIKNNKIGFHSRNFEKLTKDVEFLIKNDQMRNEMGERARKHALSTYRIKENLDKIIGFIE